MVKDVSRYKGKIVEYESSMAEDLAVVFNKFKESWPGGFGGSIPFDGERIRDWFDESSSIADLVAFDKNGTPMGFCELSPHWRDKDAAYIGLIGVIQEAKGKKFGKRLLLRSIERAIEECIERVDLHTWSGNLAAMPLYKKIGMFWVPGTSVYMQDYIPLLHQNEFTKEWFDVHEDWYEYQIRELKQESNDMTVDGMKIYRYRFEDQDDWMEVDIDRYGWGITGISRKLDDERFTIKAKVDTHEIYMGIENSYSIEFKNHTDEDKEVELDVKPFKGLKFKDDFPRCITLDKGTSKTLSREFIVDKEAETYQSTHKSTQSIETILKIDDNEFLLTTGGKIKPAVEIDGTRDMYYLFSGKEKKINFDLKNNTERVLKGEVSFKIDGEEGKKDFKLEKNENGGIGLTVNLDFHEEDVKYIELTPSIRKKHGLFPMETYRHPLVNDVQGLLSFSEKENEVYLVNNEVKVKVELEGGNVTVNEAGRDSKLPFELSQWIGPPFGRTQDSTLKYDHEVVDDKKGLHLLLQVESLHKPSLVMKKHVRIQRNSTEVEFWSELENVGDRSLKAAAQTMPRIWGFDVEPYQSKAKVFTPLGDEIIESPPGTDMLSVTMMPTEPERWKETWTAYEDIVDGTVSGLIWDKENIKKIISARGQLSELKSITKKLEPGESFETAHLWLLVKKSSLNSFRDTWNRLVGRREFSQYERVYGKERRKHIEVRLDDNIIEAGSLSKRKVIVDKVVDYPMPGEYTIKSPDYINCSFSSGEGKIKISEKDDEQLLELEVDIEVSEEPSNSVDTIWVHFSGELELDFELPVIVVGNDEVTVEEETKEGNKVLHVDNGEIQFDVLDGFGGNLIRLVDSDGNTYFDDRFPEPGPKMYFENHIGGIEPRLILPDDLEEFYEIEDVSSERFSDGVWKGVKVDLTIEKLDALRGQKFSIRYLTLPGTKFIKVILVHDNPKSKEVRWLGEFFIDVLLNETLKDTVVECPGKYDDWKRKYQTQNFMVPANLEKPWFYFTDGDISIGGFGVESSPVYSTILCNDEIDMGFLAANIVSQPFGSEKLEMGIILDTVKDEIETARKALRGQ